MQMKLFCALAMLATVVMPVAAQEPAGCGDAFKEPARKLKVGPLSLWLDRPNDAVDTTPWTMCAAIGSCRWGPIQAAEAYFSGLGPYGLYATDRCSKDWDTGTGKQVWSCSGDGGRSLSDFAKPFASMLGSLIASEACSRGDVTAEPAYHLEAGTVLALPVRSRSLGICATIASRGSGFTPAIVFHPCGADAASVLVPHALQDPLPPGNALIAVALSPEKGFRIGLQFEEGGAASSTVSHSWGPKDLSGKLDSWLSAVADAAFNGDPPLDDVDRPFADLFTSDAPAARLTAWTAAAAVRLAHQEDPAGGMSDASRKGRNWMTRTVLGGTSGSDTMLRTELMEWEK